MKQYQNEIEDSKINFKSLVVKVYEGLEGRII